MTMTHIDRKLNLAILFGGRSGEHEVSLMSARSVLAILDPARYSVTQIAITKSGRWFTGIDAIGALEKGQSDGLDRVYPRPADLTEIIKEATDMMQPLLNKRGQLLNMEQEGDTVMVLGKMPVGEMFGMSGDLRSATGGRGHP